MLSCVTRESHCRRCPACVTRERPSNLAATLWRGELAVNNNPGRATTLDYGLRRSDDLKAGALGRWGAGYALRVTDLGQARSNCKFKNTLSLPAQLILPLSTGVSCRLVLLSRKERHHLRTDPAAALRLSSYHFSRLPSLTESGWIIKGGNNVRKWKCIDTSDPTSASASSPCTGAQQPCQGDYFYSDVAIRSNHSPLETWRGTMEAARFRVLN